MSFQWVRGDYQNAAKSCDRQTRQALTEALAACGDAPLVVLAALIQRTGYRAAYPIAAYLLSQVGSPVG